MKKKYDEIGKILKSIGISEDTINTLQRIRYFTMPASSRITLHGAYSGGLAHHSLEVCKTALNLNETLNLNLPKKSIIISTLFHDLNKCYRYVVNNSKVTNKQSETKPYKVEATLIGDGDLSAFIVSNVLKLELTAPEYHAIRFHNVFEQDYQKIYHNQLQGEGHRISYKLTWLVQTSDMYVSQVLKI